MKKTIASLLMLLTSVAMMAQESKWTLMPKAGMTVSTLAGEDAEYCSNVIGWTVGVDLGRRLSERVDLTVGVGFTKNQVSDDIVPSVLPLKVYDEGRMSFSYIDVPIGISVKLWKGLSASAGVQPSLMAAGRERFFYDEYTTNSFEDHLARLEEYVSHADPATSKYTHFLKRDSEDGGGIRHMSNKLNVSASIGLQYEYKRVTLGARYHFGLTNVMDTDKLPMYSHYPDQSEFDGRHKDKMHYLSLTLGYRLPL